MSVWQALWSVSSCSVFHDFLNVVLYSTYAGRTWLAEIFVFLIPFHAHLHCIVQKVLIRYGFYLSKHFIVLKKLGRMQSEKWRDLKATNTVVNVLIYLSRWSTTPASHYKFKRSCSSWHFCKDHLPNHSKNANDSAKVNDCSCFHLFTIHFIVLLLHWSHQEFRDSQGCWASALHTDTTLDCLVSYQDEETVGWEVLVSWDGWEHRQNQAAEHQNEPKT